MGVNKNHVLMLSVIFLLEISLIQSKLSDYTTICSAKDPLLSECLARSGIQMVESLKKGIPEYDIPPIHPFYVPRADITEPVMNLSITLLNLTIDGFDGVTVPYASADPEHFSIKFLFHFPKQFYISNYIVRGKVLMFPIYGKGRSNLTFIDVDLLWELKGKKDVREGVTYMKITEFNTEIQPKLMAIHFDNLFNGNKILGNTMNTMLNRNWGEIYNHMKPVFENQFRYTVYKNVEKVFDRTPYNEIFNDLDV